MIKTLLKIWPILFIFLVWFIFASPYFLKARAPFASTYQLNNFAPWDAYPKFQGPVKNGAMPDVITQIYPWRHLAIDIWKSGQIPLWNPYSFAGTPFLANYQSAVLSPLNILFFILPFVDGWSLLVLLQPLLAGIFTYLFVWALGRSNFAGLISAVSFMFCGFITVWMGYATLSYAILFSPLALFSIERFYATRRKKFLALLSLSIPLSFFSGHFQISAYFLIVVGLYDVLKFIEKRDKALFIKTSLFILFGILLSLPQLLPSVEFYLQSLRSNIFGKQEVIPLNYLPTLLAPDFFGNPVTRNDWFGHYAEWNGYIGVLPLILAWYSLVIKKKGKAIFFMIVGLASLVLSLDTKIAELFISLKIPVLSTSSESRIISVYSLMFSVLASFGYDQLVEDLKNKKNTKILYFIAAFLALFVFLWLSISTKIFMPLDKAYIAQSNLKLPSIIFAGVLASIILIILNKKLLPFLGIIFLVLVSFDMLRFSTKWQEFSPKNLVFAETPTGQAFSKISADSRVIGNFGAESSVYYKLPSLEGYDALYIKRYGEFAASLIDGKLSQSYRSVVQFPIDSPNTPASINLLDVKYIVHKFADGRFGWTFPYWKYPDGQFTQIYKDDAYDFYQNNAAFDHAFLASDYTVTSDPQKIMNILTDKKTDLAKTIVLEEDPHIAKSQGNVGTSKIVSYSPDEVDINVSVNKVAMLFLSDNYYPGWKANIDGKETKIYRADYSFRAIVVPSGKHTVKFVYSPSSFKWGIVGAIAGILGIIFFTFFPKSGVPKSSS